VPAGLATLNTLQALMLDSNDCLCLPGALEPGVSLGAVSVGLLCKPVRCPLKVCDTSAPLCVAPVAVSLSGSPVSVSGSVSESAVSGSPSGPDTTTPVTPVKPVVPVPSPWGSVSGSTVIISEPPTPDVPTPTPTVSVSTDPKTDDPDVKRDANGNIIVDSDPAADDGTEFMLIGAACALAFVVFFFCFFFARKSLRKQKMMLTKVNSEGDGHDSSLMQNRHAAKDSLAPYTAATMDYTDDMDDPVSDTSQGNALVSTAGAQSFVAPPISPAPYTADDYNDPKSCVSVAPAAVSRFGAAVSVTGAAMGGGGDVNVGVLSAGPGAPAGPPPATYGGGGGSGGGGTALNFKPMGAVMRDVYGNWVDANDEPLLVATMIPLGGADGVAWTPLGAVGGDAVNGYCDADGQLIVMSVPVVEPQYPDEASFRAVYAAAPPGAVGLDQFGNYVDVQGLVLPVAQSAGSGGGGGGAAGQTFVPAGSVGRDVHGNWVNADGAVISVLMIGTAAKMAFDSMNPDSPDNAIGVDRYGNYVDSRGNVIPTIMATGGGGGGGGAAGGGGGYSSTEQFTPLGAVGRDTHGNFIDATGRAIPVIIATGSGGGGGGSAGGGAGYHQDQGFTAPTAGPGAPSTPAPNTASRVGPPSANAPQFDPVSVSAAPVMSVYQPTQVYEQAPAAMNGYVPDSGGGIQVSPITHSLPFANLLILLCYLSFATIHSISCLLFFSLSLSGFRRHAGDGGDGERLPGVGDRERRGEERRHVLLALRRRVRGDLAVPGAPDDDRRHSRRALYQRRRHASARRRCVRRLLRPGGGADAAGASQVARRCDDAHLICDALIRPSWRIV
jgi:hypothetical protein